MNLVIIKDGPNRVSAYSTELLAGCAGYPGASEFLDACRNDQKLALDTAAQIGEPFDLQQGMDALAVLRERLDESGHKVDASFSTTPPPRVSSAFEGLLRAGQATVLAQVARLPDARKAMTTAAAAMATTVLVSMAAAPEAKAADLGRYAKDSMGALIGGAIMHNFGKGKGKVALTAFGAAAGVAIAEEMQKPRQPTPPNYGQGNASYQPSSVGGMGGTEGMPADLMGKMATQQQNTLMLRDQYARALYVAQMAEDNRVVDPHNKALVEAATLANSMTRAPEQRYLQARSDFISAYEHLARRGYDVHDFAITYAMMQKQVTARDMSPQDMSGIRPRQPAQVSQGFTFQGD